jgi:hypothetical protein
MLQACGADLIMSEEQCHSSYLLVVVLLLWPQQCLGDLLLQHLERCW